MPEPADDDGAPVHAAKRARTSSPERPTTVADAFEHRSLLAHADDGGAFEDDMAVPGEEVARARAKDEGWEDLDEEDEFDPMMVSEYVREIFVYMQKLEVRPASLLPSRPSSSTVGLSPRPVLTRRGRLPLPPRS